MSWIALGSAAIGAGGAVGAAAMNRKRKSSLPAFQPYTGYRPPEVKFLRPVEEQITDIVMKRSKGEGVGYDPARRQALLDNFNIEQGRDLEDQKRDINNQLAGMGLSRNAAVYDDMMGRALREAGREKNLYTNRIDIEDLARANEERDVNTGRLQNLNTMNFNQENKRADFDFGVYNAEQGNRYRGYELESNDYAQNYQDPIGTALEMAGSVGDIFGGEGGGIALAKATTPTYDTIHTSIGPGVRKDTMGNYLANVALRKGKNLQR